MFSETRREVFLIVAEASVEKEKGPPSHAYGLAKKMGLDRSTTGRHLEGLFEEGLIEPLSGSDRTVELVDPPARRRVEYGLTNNGWDLVEIVKLHPDIFLGETKRDILDYMTGSDEGVYGYALADELSLQRSNAYTHLADLEEVNLVWVDRREGKKVYLLTDTGSTVAGVLCA